MHQDLERKLQQHSDEIVKLIKDIKLKDQLLQESNVKIEILEKRMEVAKKQAEQIALLEESLNKSQTQEQIYAEAIENLRTEYETLEQENSKLKKDMASKSEEKKSMPKQSIDLSSATRGSVVDFAADIGENGPAQLYRLGLQVETLQTAIRYLRVENAYLKATDAARTLELDSHSATSIIDRPNQKQSDKPCKSLIVNYTNEARRLVKDARAAIATPKVVRLSPGARGGKWQSKEQLPYYNHYMQKSVLYTIQQRCEQLKKKVAIVSPTCLERPFRATGFTKVMSQYHKRRLTMN
ncbi:hypothetical protein BDF20DRAFT_235770 [Mycotypha africana]|uniref:uncharacterized protein n=1 Tax=Mycotypha africana TaxID=64632 RepID=UPI0023011E19|nr:uncharacterized protein BDF20DRAFT_235770 [Mycotypha africana]KAI8967450.1 hypothetical protein BDF20DRAFT_235770 [Mycotypha africana]